MEFIADQYQALGIGALIFFVLIVLEFTWSYNQSNQVYNTKDTLSNFAFLIGGRIFKALLAGAQISFFYGVSAYAFIQLPNNWIVFSITFLLVDFVYYWYHRFSHTIKFLWAIHLVHHSSNYFNLTTSYRLHWFGGLISTVFYIPLILLGFPLEFVLVSFGINLGYQFLLHTQFIGKLGFLEGILDTPSAHRVHHGTNPNYMDKNFGGVFMFWDVLFGTYQPENEKPIFGITNGFISYNPLKIMLFGVKLIFKRDSEKHVKLNSNTLNQPFSQSNPQNDFMKP